jgi:hypothetical protein
MQSSYFSRLVIIWLCLLCWSCTEKRSSSSTPENIVNAYLDAASWEGRLPFVINPESVRSEMASKYKNANFTNIRQGFSPCIFYPSTEPTPPVGGSTILKLNVSQALPDHEYLRFVVVRTTDGYKVDWRETMRLGDEDNERAARNKLKLTEPFLQVAVLKVYQSSVEHTSLDIRVTNTSNKFISFWQIGADLNDSSGQYLGHEATNGANLRPEQAATERIIFRSIRASQVSSYKLSLDDVILDLGGGNKVNATKYFNIKQAEN